MESFAALFEESLQRQEMRAGEVITAEIVRIDQNFVVVNAGLKSESMIPVEEFHNERGELEAKPGDFVLVAIEMLEDGYGATRLSREKAKRIAAWNDLDKAMVDSALVTGLITGKVKGGLTVMVNGIRAFLPGSLVDTRPVKDTTPFEGKEYEFKVIKLDRKRNNVVVSRRAVLEASMGEERQKLLENLQEGTIIKGIVKNITDYGAFVDLGGIDGLLHITDLAWRRVRHPSEVLNVGDEVTAKVLKFDQEKNRVSLGMKQLGEDPWVGIARRYPQGTRLFGKVKGGLTVMVNGIRAFLPGSLVDTRPVKDTTPFEGKEYEFKVIKLDRKRNNVVVSRRAVLEASMGEERQKLLENLQEGTVIKGIVKNITDYGAFVDLGGIDGLLHITDLAWRRVRHPSEVLNVGDEVDRKSVV